MRRKTTDYVDSHDDAAAGSREGHGPHREVSYFFTEKLMCVLDHIQIFAIVWSSAQSWPAPSDWAAATSWTLMANVDVVGWDTWMITRPGAPARSTPVPVFGVWEGKFGGYVLYASLFAAVPVLLFAMHLVGVRRDSTALRSVALRAAEFFYIPVALAVFRLGHCAPDGKAMGRLSVDPDVVCGSLWHLVPMVATFVVAGAYLLGLPALLVLQIRGHLVYEEPAAHESRLVWCESEYLLGLNNFWKDGHMSSFSSFRRAHVYHRAWTMIHKLAIVLVFSFARWPTPARALDPDIEDVLSSDTSGQSPQALILFALLVVWAVLQTVVPPYRCGSTTTVCLSLEWPLIVMVFLGWLKASGVRSALVIDSAIMVMNTFLGVASLIGVCYGLFWKAGYHKERWPTRAACGTSLAGESARQRSRRLARARMPMRGMWFVPSQRARRRCCGSVCGRVDVAIHDMEVAQWLATVRKAQRLLHKCALTPGLMMPVDELEDMTTSIRGKLPRAMRQGHVLGRSLTRVLQHATVLIAKHQHETMQPNPVFQGENMRRLRKRLDEREDARILAHPSRSSTLFKLLALRSWIGERDIATSEREALPDVARYTVEAVDQTTFHVRFRAGPLFMDLKDSGAFAADADENVAGILSEEDAVRSFARERQLSVVIHGFSLPTSGKVGPAEACKEVQKGQLIVAVNHEPLDGLPFDGAISKISRASWPKILTFIRPTGTTPATLDASGPSAAESLSTKPQGSVFTASTDVVGKTWQELLESQQQGTEISRLLIDTWALCREAEGAEDGESSVNFGVLHDNRSRIRDCIHEWELDFKRANRRKPKRKEKEEIKEWYNCAEAATRLLPLRLRH